MFLESNDVLDCCFLTKNNMTIYYSAIYPLLSIFTEKNSLKFPNSLPCTVLQRGYKVIDLNEYTGVFTNRMYLTSEAQKILQPFICLTFFQLFSNALLREPATSNVPINHLLF